MKKLGETLTLLGISGFIVGIVVTVLVVFTPLELILFKSFLVDALQENGYEVRWENVEQAEGNMLKMNVLTALPEKEGVKVVHFGEYGNRLVVGIEKSRTGDTISIEKAMISWPNLAPLYELFPFEEVRSVRGKMLMLQQRIPIYILASSLFLLLVGAIANKRKVQPAFSQKGRTVRKTVRKKVPRVADPTPVAQLQALPVVSVVIPRPQQRDRDQDWAPLLEKVRCEIDHVQGEVKKSLENEFADLLAEEKPGRKARKARHLLSKIQKIREAISQEPVEIGEGIPISDPRSPMLPPPSLEQVLKALLPIDEYVPSDLNPKIVRKVILAFLRPGHEVPFVEASFTSLEDLLKHMREVPRDEAEGILKWLRGIGVLMEHRPHRKAGRTFVSLKIHAKDVGSPGREIIQIIARAAYEKARMG